VVASSSDRSGKTPRMKLGDKPQSHPGASTNAGTRLFPLPPGTGTWKDDKGVGNRLAPGGWPGAGRGLSAGAVTRRSGATA
jgi:hypothetical protein